MDFLTNVPAFLLALGAIVFIHEFGHHVVAKLCGVRVLTFSLGFGTRLWGFRHKGTDYRLSLVPLGGYVRMGGELPDEATGDPRDLLSKPRWQRILVYLAGPAMNIVLSISLFTLVFMIGIPIQALQEIPSIVGSIAEGSAAEEAGLVAGDRIVKVGGEEVEKWRDMEFVFQLSPEKPVTVELERQGQPLTTVLTPKREVSEGTAYGDAGIAPRLTLSISTVFADAPAHGAGFVAEDVLQAIDGEPIRDSRHFIDHIEGHGGRQVAVTVKRGAETLVLDVTPKADEEGHGKIGVEIMTSFHYRALPFGEAVMRSVEENVDIITKSLQILGKLLTNEISAKNSLSGPIEIAVISSRAAQRGFTNLLYVIGFLSTAIAFMNLLPIPVLDGGHISILLIESVMRRDMSILIKERLTQVGFMLLMALMAVVIFFDIEKRFDAAREREAAQQQEESATPEEP